jgi:homopolymeric O-antigen transport system ATP-binding protein
MPPAITVDNISKAYRIGLKEKIPDTLVSAIAGMARSPLRKFRELRRLNTFRHNGHDDPDTFWALRGVSFDVAEGEVLGIIGRNGAGKSTLLKILSRITEPTSGRAVIRGRVSSLLEVGTGFHPDLTGRENVYLNGTILGMTKREIDRKFDEIVDFSGVEKFLDTPIKRYSSGMSVRLAFAVAAHLEPEILIVDEVLAVGDAEFQRKCIQRMREVATSGRPVLFVSHNMEVIPQICQMGVLLEAGQIRKYGDASAISREYLDTMRCVNLPETNRRGDGRARFEKIELIDPSGSVCANHVFGNPLRVRLGVRSSERISPVSFALTICSIKGLRVTSSWSKETGQEFRLLPGYSEFDCIFENVTLRPGHDFSLMIWMGNDGAIDFVEDALVFRAVPNSNSAHLSPDSQQGSYIVESKWMGLVDVGQADAVTSQLHREKC